MDVLKGFAILLVVIGHLIQLQISPNHFDSNLFFKLIYSFHMALFFFLAGNVFKIKPLNIELIFCFKRLIFPFFFFFFIVSCNFNYQVFMLKAFEYILNPQLGFWFLFVLAIIRILFDILLLVNKTYGFVILTLFYTVGVLMGKLFAIDYVLFYFSFFAAGYFVSHNQSKFFYTLHSLFFRRGVAGLLTILLLIIFYSYVFNFYHRNLIGVSLVEFIMQKNILAILGILLCYKIFQMFSFRALSKAFEFMGKYTLFIYGFHLLFLGCYKYFGLLNIIPMIIIPIAIAKFFYFLIPRFNSFFSKYTLLRHHPKNLE